jgi:peptidoglycan-associated lipoprotein
MINVRGAALLVIPLLVAALGVAGCPKRPGSGVGATAPAPSGATSSAAGQSAAGSASASGQSAASAGAGQKDAASLKPSDFARVASLKDIRFDFDKYDVRPDDARILDANATWLKSNGAVQVLIEGHCDERGTQEYNLALGERRARAAMSYLVGHGINAGRMRVISYGEEQPLCSGHDESCWLTNRRDHFLGSGK